MGEKIANGAYVREYFQVPAFIGRRIIWRGNLGTIVGFDLAYLLVELDADPLEGDPEEVVVHPRWEVEYDPVEKPTGRGRPRPVPNTESDPGGTAGDPDGDGTPAPAADVEPANDREQQAA